MRKAASLVGTRRAAAGGGGAPATPTISAITDTEEGQKAAIAFSWSSGSSLTGLDVRWSTSAGMTSPTTFTTYTGNLTRTSDFASIALGSAVAGTSYTVYTDTLTGTRPADGVSAYYQVRLTNASGTSSWSSAFGPVATSFVP